MTLGERIKTGMKRSVKAAAVTAGRLSPAPKACSRILTYHSVGRRDHEMNVTPEAFREQMAWLAENCKVVPLAEAVEGRGGVAITFDDGYRDNLTEAAPVLREFGLPATVFVVADRLGGMLDHDDNPATSTLMTWDEAKQLEAQGVTIGGHGMTHRRLSGLNEEEQREEIGGCRLRIEEALGHPVEAFAYPFGSSLDYTSLTESLVQESGYDFALSNRYGPVTPGANRWALRRIWVDRTDGIGAFQAKVEGRMDGLALLDSGLGIRARRAVNRLLGIR